MLADGVIGRGSVDQLLEKVRGVEHLAAASDIMTFVVPTSGQKRASGGARA